MLYTKEKEKKDSKMIIINGGKCGIAFYLLK